MTGTDLLKRWYGFLLVAGNAYMEAVALDGEIRELHALRPDRMKVVPGPDGWPVANEAARWNKALLDNSARPWARWSMRPPTGR